MGVPTVGITGAVTSWAGTANTALLSAIGAHTASLRISGGNAERTAFAGSLTSEAMGPGLLSWTGQIQARFPSTAVNGIAGALSISGGYNLHIQKWSLSISARVLEFVSFGATATAAGWKSARPGLLSITGKASSLIDGTTAIALPSVASGSAASATFTLDGTRSFTGNVFYSATNPTISVGDLNRVDFDLLFDGAITAVGSGNLFAAGAVGLPDWDTSGSDGIPDADLVLTAASGRTYTGPCWWKQITIDVDPGAYTTVSIDIQGAGVLATA